MKFVYAAGTIALAASAVAPTELTGQSAPATRTIATLGAPWISGIVETRNGRFIVYAAGDSIFIRNRQAGTTTAVFARVVDLIVNSIGSSASGDRIVFTSFDDQEKGPYLWTLAIDTAAGRPIGAPRRVGVVPATDPSLSPDGRRIAFIERNPSVGGIRGAARLVVVSSSGGEGTVLLDVTGKGGLRAPRWSADGASIFYQHYPPQPAPGTGPSLWRIASSGGRPDSLTRVNLFTDAAPSAGYLALFPKETNWQRTLRPQFAVTGLDGKTITRFQLPPGARPYAWSRASSSRILAVRSEPRSVLKSLSLEDRTEKRAAATQRQPRKPKYSPNGKLLAYHAFVGDRLQFVIEDLAAGTSRVVKTEAEPENRWLWSPDGAWIAFTVRDGGDWVHVVNVVTGTERRLVQVAAAGFQWRSDSKSLVHVPAPTTAAMPTEIRLVTVDGRVSRAGLVPASMAPGDWISLKDDSSFIFRHEENGVRRLSVVSMPSGQQRTVYTGPVSLAASPITVSPDGRWIAFSANAPNGGEQVMIASLDGKESRAIGTPLACGAGPAAWLPDGRHILAWGYPVCAGGSEVEALYLFSLNGDAPRRLTDASGGHGESSYSLSPDGRTIVFEAEDGPPVHHIVEFDFGTSLRAQRSPSRTPARAP